MIFRYHVGFWYRAVFGTDETTQSDDAVWFFNNCFFIGQGA